MDSIVSKNRSIDAMVESLTEKVAASDRRKVFLGFAIRQLIYISYGMLWCIDFALYIYDYLLVWYALIVLAFRQCRPVPQLQRCHLTKPYFPYIYLNSPFRLIDNLGEGKKGLEDCYSVLAKYVTEFKMEHDNGAKGSDRVNEFPSCKKKSTQTRCSRALYIYIYI